MSEKQDDDEGWKNIKFSDIQLGDRIGGGGVGIIYKGRLQ